MTVVAGACTRTYLTRKLCSIEKLRRMRGRTSCLRVQAGGGRRKANLYKKAKKTFGSIYGLNFPTPDGAWLRSSSPVFPHPVHLALEDLLRSQCASPGPLVIEDEDENVRSKSVVCPSSCFTPPSNSLLRLHYVPSPTPNRRR